MATTREIPRAWVPGAWALVLAGGEGSRLQALTTAPNGVVVPKQFCSLRHGPSLLAQALMRAGTVAPTIQTCAVVAEQHRRWWGVPLGSLPRENVFIQPQNKGTAHGMLLALLRLQARDPAAVVVVLPADHYVRHESLLAHSLRQMGELAAHAQDVIYMLGVEPNGADTEMGYIVPAERKPNEPARVTSFIERPTSDRVRGLLKMGALWNMFVLAGSVRALLGLYSAAHGSSVARMSAIIGASKHHNANAIALATLYRDLPPLDFSRDVLEPQADKLRVICVPRCGWNDLGTPKRVMEALLQLPPELAPIDARPLSSAALCLADQYGRLERHELEHVGVKARRRLRIDRPHVTRRA